MNQLPEGQFIDTAGRKPRLMFVVTEDWYFVSHRLRLAQAAVSAGFEVAVATRVGREARTLEVSGLHVVALEKLSRTSRNPWHEAQAILELRRVYAAWRPDIVHHVAIKPVIYGSLAARMVGLHAVVNALAGLGFVFSSDSLKAQLLQMLIRPLLKLALGGNRSRVIVQNPDDSRVLADLGLAASDRIRLIRGAGVNLEKFSAGAMPRGRPIVILAARMLWDKGVGAFVDVARALQEGGIDARFVLVGESDPGNPAAVPETQLAQWRSAGVVEWWGRRIDMPEVFLQASIVCLPTTYGEGIPKVLIEAAACGRPIVAYDVPGCREIVRNGKNGLLVPRGDVAGLASAVSTLLADSDLRANMGRKGREIAVEEFSEALVVAQTFDLYRELAEQWIEQQP